MPLAFYVKESGNCTTQCKCRCWLCHWGTRFLELSLYCIWPRGHKMTSILGITPSFQTKTRASIKRQNLLQILRKNIPTKNGSWWLTGFKFLKTESCSSHFYTGASHAKHTSCRSLQYTVCLRCVSDVWASPYQEYRDWAISHWAKFPSPPHLKSAISVGIKLVELVPMTTGWHFFGFAIFIWEEFYGSHNLELYTCSPPSSSQE